jgi:arginyl-tRNA synthetase
MSSDLKSHLADLMRAALLSVAPTEADSAIHIERPKQASHGDFSCNLAMQLARSLKRNPRQLAQLLVSELPYSSPGRQDRSRRRRLHQLPSCGRRPSSKSYARRPRTGRGLWPLDDRRQSKVLVEFVSANPTGPLHVGHGRGAAYGGSLCKLLAFAGWDVTSEYYVNDAGRQMDILAVSTWLRYLELRGQAAKP